MRTFGLMMVAVLLVGNFGFADIHYATADTYFLSENTAWTGGNTDQYIAAGYSPSGLRRVAMIKFDLSSYSGMEVTNATLWVYKNSGAVANGAAAPTIHRITNDWNSYWACWDNRNNGVAWDTPGGDFDSTVIASAPSGDATEGWYQIDLTATVQDWADGTNENYGVAMKYTTGYNYLVLRSSNYAGTTYDPYISINAVPEPATLALISLGSLCVLRKKK